MGEMERRKTTCQGLWSSMGIISDKRKLFIYQHKHRKGYENRITEISYWNPLLFKSSIYCPDNMKRHRRHTYHKKGRFPELYVSDIPAVIFCVILVTDGQIFYLLECNYWTNITSGMMVSLNFMFILSNYSEKKNQSHYTTWNFDPCKIVVRIFWNGASTCNFQTYKFH